MNYYRCFECSLAHPKYCFLVEFFIPLFLLQNQPQSINYTQEFVADEADHIQTSKKQGTFHECIKNFPFSVDQLSSNN